MRDIGQQLCEARETLGLTLDEVERATRIRKHHLEALEKGDLDALPSPVQARGFLNNYAEFLGLDTDTLLLHYADTVQARGSRFRKAEIRAEQPTRPSKRGRSSRPRWFSSDVLLSIVILLPVIGVLIWGIGRVMTMLRENGDAGQETSMFMIPTFTPSPSSTLAPVSSTSVPIEMEAPIEQPTETSTLAIFLGPSNLVDIRIVVEKSAWLRVIVDGQEQYQDRGTPGTLLEFQGEQQIEITTGNAGGIHVFFQAQDQGILGEVGQVVTRVWTLEGSITPTPTQTFTPTTTPAITNTSNAVPTQTLAP